MPAYEQTTRGRHGTSEALRKITILSSPRSYGYHDLEHRLIEAVDDRPPTHHVRRHRVGHE